MCLYKRIKDRREALGLSQDELASRLNYKSRSTIAKIESGANDIPQSKIKAFADALNTTTAYLMGWDDDEPYDNEMEAKNATEKELLLLCRKVDDEPDEVKEQILEQFKSTIDIYLKAKGIR